MPSDPLPHRLLAEGLGALLLAATVVGSWIMAELLAGGNHTSVDHQYRQNLVTDSQILVTGPAATQAPRHQLHRETVVRDVRQGLDSAGVHVASEW
jgi:hypothetical protein